MSPNEFVRFLAVSDVAEILGVTTGEVHDLLDSGELASLRVGSRGPVRVDVKELEAFIAHRYEAEQHLLRLRQAEYANVYDLSDGRLL